MKRRAGPGSCPVGGRPSLPESLHLWTLPHCKAQMFLRNTKTRRSPLTIVLALFLTSLTSSMARPVDTSAPSGTVISNTAVATYSDSDGENFNTVSATVTITVMAVTALTVAPKETQPSANVGPREQVTRLFRVCNSGNVASTYTVTQAGVNAPSTLVSLYFDNDGDGAVSNPDSQISVGTTQSHSVAPGSCLGVLAVVNTNDAPVNSLLQITLRVHANAAGAGTSDDNGTIINSLGKGAVLGHPTDPNLPPLKQINGTNQQVITRGGTLTYSITFRNTGDVTAHAVVLTDDLISGLDYTPNTLKLEFNGTRNLTDA